MIHTSTFKYNSIIFKFLSIQKKKSYFFLSCFTLSHTFPSVNEKLVPFFFFFYIYLFFITKKKEIIIIILVVYSREEKSLSSFFFLMYNKKSWHKEIRENHLFIYFLLLSQNFSLSVLYIKKVFFFIIVFYTVWHIFFILKYKYFYY